MGQKIHPVGLRVGLHRKWNQTWFATEKQSKIWFYNQRNLEFFFKSYFQKFAYTKISLTKKLILVDLKFFKIGARCLYLFIFFYKMRTKRRKAPRLFKLKRRSRRKKKRSVRKYVSKILRKS